MRDDRWPFFVAGPPVIENVRSDDSVPTLWLPEGCARRLDQIGQLLLAYAHAIFPLIMSGIPIDDSMPVPHGKSERSTSQVTTDTAMATNLTFSHTHEPQNTPEVRELSYAFPRKINLFDR